MGPSDSLRSPKPLESHFFSFVSRSTFWVKLLFFRVSLSVDLFDFGVDFNYWTILSIFTIFDLLFPLFLKAWRSLVERSRETDKLSKRSTWRRMKLKLATLFQITPLRSSLLWRMILWLKKARSIKTTPNPVKWIFLR